MTHTDDEKPMSGLRIVAIVNHFVSDSEKELTERKKKEEKEAEDAKFWKEHREKKRREMREIVQKATAESDRLNAERLAHYAHREWRGSVATVPPTTSSLVSEATPARAKVTISVDEYELFMKFKQQQSSV